MKNFLTALLIVAAVLTTAVVDAAVQTFDGHGRYVMSELENSDVAKMRAQKKAEHDACEKAAVYVKSFCQANDINLTDDEIAAVVRNTIIIDDVQVEPKTIDINGESAVIWTATVKVTFDTDAVLDFVTRAEKN